MNKLYYTILLSTVLYFLSTSQNNLTYVETNSFEDYTLRKKSKLKLFNFELDGGLIMLPVTIGRKSSPFILDTGAPSVIINKKRIKNASFVANGIGGHSEIEKSMLKNFSFHNIKFSKLKVLKMNLDHLERVKQRKLGGLIGLDVLFNKVLFLDYHKQKIGFLNYYSKKKLKKRYTKVHSIEFEMIDHFPVIEIVIGGKTFKMALDTGAELNVFDTNSLKNVPLENYRFGKRKFIQGTSADPLNGTELLINNSEMDHCYLQDLFYTTMNLSNLTFEKKLDGILGFPFLKQFIISIDYQKQEICFYEDCL